MARKRCPSAPNFGGSLLFMHSPFDTKLPDLTRQYMWGGGLFIGGQPCHRPKELGSQCSPILGFLSIHAYTLCRRTTILIDVETHGACFLGQQRPTPRGRVPAFSRFLGGPFCLCVHPLSQNYQIWLGNTCGEGAYILRLAKPPTTRVWNSWAA